MSTLTTNQAIEIIRLKVSPGSVDLFLAKRDEADLAISTIPGFISSEFCRQNEDDWILIVRWQSLKLVLEAQKVTEQMQEISDWISAAKEFISFDTVEVKKSFQS